MSYISGNTALIAQDAAGTTMPWWQQLISSLPALATAIFGGGSQTVQPPTNPYQPVQQTNSPNTVTILIIAAVAIVAVIYLVPPGGRNRRR